MRGLNFAGIKFRAEKSPKTREIKSRENKLLKKTREIKSRKNKLLKNSREIKSRENKLLKKTREIKSRENKLFGKFAKLNPRENKLSKILAQNGQKGFFFGKSGSVTFLHLWSPN